MSFWCNNNISRLDLVIPISDLPLKSDLIVGYERPHMLYPNDECSCEELHPKVTETHIHFLVTENTPITLHECDNAAIDELVKLCKKYDGTVICESVGEDGNVDHIRVRNGKEKKVTVVEV